MEGDPRLGWASLATIMVLVGHVVREAADGLHCGPQSEIPSLHQKQVIPSKGLIMHN